MKTETTTPDGHDLLRRLVPSEAFWSRASCAQTDPEAFFPEKGESVRHAKAICNDSCPIKQECLDWALSRAEEHGVWGGLSGLERKKILKEKKERQKVAPAAQDIRAAA